jgi:hypothetical protein
MLHAIKGPEFFRYGNICVRLQLFSLQILKTCRLNNQFLDVSVLSRPTKEKLWLPRLH